MIEEHSCTLDEDEEMKTSGTIHKLPAPALKLPSRVAVHSFRQPKRKPRLARSHSNPVTMYEYTQATIDQTEKEGSDQIVGQTVSSMVTTLVSSTVHIPSVVENSLPIMGVPLTQSGPVETFYWCVLCSSS